MGRPAAVTVGVVALAVALVATPAIGVSSSDSVLTQPEGFDRTVFDVTVYANGSATWTFEHRRALENDSEEANFQAFADEFESNETALYRTFVNQSVVLAQTGTDRSGREMTVHNHSRAASINRLGQTEGIVRMSFLWTNFAPVDGGRVVVADVFEGGLVLGENQRIVFEGGDDVRFADVQPSDYTASGDNLSRSDSVTFFGPKEFADRRPRVAYAVVGSTNGAVDDEAGTNVAMFALVVVLLLGTVTALAWRTGLLDRTRARTSTAVDQSPQTTPVEIRSDSDRVIDLLRENGGRMKQVRIVEETDWSKSKVSMLLSDMEDEGEITKLRVGRENIVSLAGHEPDAAGSPFEDDE